MNTFNISTIRFSGHDTFPLRHTWLPKAINLVKNHPEKLRDDGLTMLELGVGKNMARAVKHWAESTTFIEYDLKKRVHNITNIGDFLFSDEGDPYLENPDTIWLIHYLICSNPKKNGLWIYLFNYFTEDLIDKERFKSNLIKWIDDNDLNQPSISTLTRDYQCCINMYSENIGVDINNVKIEDTLASPLKELRLIKKLNYKNQYELRRLATQEISSNLFNFCLLDYIEKRNYPASITIEELLYRPFTPGRIFRLTESLLVDYLLDFQRLTKGKYIFDSTAGIHQLLLRDKSTIKKKAWLRRIYS